jgi:hypothetical protein
LPDLTDQYRILYVLYESYYKDKRTSIWDLQTSNELKYMHMVAKLIPELTYLRKTGYVEGTDDDLQLTGEGLKTTISIFRKFLTFIKKEYPETLSTWIKNLELRQNDSWMISVCYCSSREPSRTAIISKTCAHAKAILV